MKFQRFNWQIWAGFLLSLVAFISYFFVFVRFPVTRDFPWANLLLFGIAVVLLVIGVRRAFAPDRRLRSKVAASVVAGLSVLVLGLFVFATLIMARWLPGSEGIPKVGQKAPEFTLTDTNSKQVSLADLLSGPIESAQSSSPQPATQAVQTTPKGVLLIFYRGYW